MSKRARMSIVALAVLFDLGSGHHAAADEPNADYAGLQKAVLDGKDVHMVLDLAACQVQGTDKAGPTVKGSARFDAYMVQADGTIAFANTHFTVRADKTPVIEFLSYRVRTNGKVEMRNVVLNPATFAVIRESAFDCDIGKGVTFHW
ncbi:VirK family protein [Bradyrhizobium sp. Ai1a-2]|uniref:VirK family protein n=1 Tax=Bradyrhizobium sp. Ai1a-2 TaxID=196490 RepID=UPI000416DEED|nr:VirK family protein [Bradyrhizobium sp. Ai1a-2]